MFDEWIERLKSIIKSRTTILAILFCILGGILVYRCFDLQIVRGQEYLDNFVLMTEKTREIPSTRGRILDRNGKVLAYNELAYSVRLEDVYDSDMSSSAKNRQMNSNIYSLIKMVEKNGDRCSTRTVNLNTPYREDLFSVSLLTYMERDILTI